jgi:hypothetical protein
MHPPEIAAIGREGQIIFGVSACDERLFLINVSIH